MGSIIRNLSCIDRMAPEAAATNTGRFGSAIRVRHDDRRGSGGGGDGGHEELHRVAPHSESGACLFRLDVGRVGFTATPGSRSTHATCYLSWQTNGSNGSFNQRI